MNVAHIHQGARRLLSALSVGYACASTLSGQGRVPELRRVVFTNGLDSAIWQSTSRLAVSSGGVVGLVAQLVSGKGLFHLVNPRSASLVSVARAGAGPGEIGPGAVPFSSDSTFVIFDLRKPALVRYAADGRFLGEKRQLDPLESIIAIAGDSIDALRLDPDPRRVNRTPYRRHGNTNTGRPLVTESDTFLLRLSRRRAENPSTTPPLAYATAERQTAIGDAARYRLAVYDDRGARLYLIKRSVPAERLSPEEIASARKSINSLIAGDRGNPQFVARLKARLDTLQRETRPFFGVSALHFDNQGRLWAIGETHGAVFADVFTNGRFIARTLLPCGHPGARIAMNGRWLAMMCQYHPDGAAPWQLQLYEIIG